MEEWAALEMAPWQRLWLRRRDMREALGMAALRDPSIAIFRIADGLVTLEPTQPGLMPELVPLVTSRAALYREFLQAIVAEHRIDGDMHLGIRMQDRGPEDGEVPVFGFHRVRFERTVLVPDLDFIISNFYAATEFQDGRSFAEKLPEAYFIGATTGGLVTMQSVRDGTHSRIRAALFFRDKPGVTFEISKVVQCDSDETQRAVEALVPMSSGWRTWQDQFAYRYILSIDGNGATWSRTAVALASNSALVKYASPSLLYYMHGLEPWVHFIPVRRDRDLLDMIARADTTAERDAAIAEAGRDFAARHFSREAVTGYMAALLREYAGAIGA